MGDKFSVYGRPISASMSAYTLRDTPDDPSPLPPKRKLLPRIQSIDRVSADLTGGFIYFITIIHIIISTILIVVFHLYL